MFWFEVLAHRLLEFCCYPHWPITRPQTIYHLASSGTNYLAFWSRSKRWPDDFILLKTKDDLLYLLLLIKFSTLVLPQRIHFQKCGYKNKVFMKGNIVLVHNSNKILYVFIKDFVFLIQLNLRDYQNIWTCFYYALTLTEIIPFTKKLLRLSYFWYSNS